MRLDQAYNIKVGDKLINCFMENLVVMSVFHHIGHKEDSFIIGTVDTRMRLVDYSYQDLYYLDSCEELCDEELSWINWAKDNYNELYAEDNLALIQSAYMKGFANGFEHKEAWKRYDKPAEDYYPTTRQYSNRPPKSGNESC
jgi:hypothetical protein